MTKVARLFEEEKIEAMNEVANKTLINERLRIAKDMLAFGEDLLKIMQITKLSRAEIESLI